MPQHIICSSCRQLLIIPDYAPPRLTCPKCLSPVNNPHPYEERPQPQAMTRARDRPRPVIPVEQEVHKDFRSAAYGMLALAVLLAVGAAASFTLLGSPIVGGMLLLMTMLLAALAVGIAQRSRPPAGSAAPAYAGDRPDSPAGRVILDYQAAAPTSILRGCVLVLAVIGGIMLLLLGFCAMAVFSSSLGGPWPPR